MENVLLAKESAQTVGNALRKELFDKILPIIVRSDNIAQTSIRLNIQANCLDLTIAVEEFIERYGLDCIEDQGFPN